MVRDGRESRGKTVRAALPAAPREGKAASQPESTQVMEWLLDPRERALRYLASRDLVTPRPSGATLAHLRAAVPRRGWFRDILGRQKEGTWWATKAIFAPPGTWSARSSAWGTAETIE